MQQKPRGVYIGKEALLAMIHATIEAFPDECMGNIFGSTPTRRKKRYLIKNAIPFQLAEKRNNDSFTLSDHSAGQLSFLVSQAPTLYPSLGSFHSHPEGEEKIKNPFELEEMSEASKVDKKSMRKTEEKIMLILTVSTSTKVMDRWRNDHIDGEGWIEGRLGSYNFYITAHAILEKRGKKKGKIKKVRIFAPEAIRALNKAQKIITRNKKKK